LKGITRYYRVDSREIGFIGFTVHAYEGLGVVRTLDPAQGIIEILLSPDLVEGLEGLMEDLQKEISIEEIGPEEIFSIIDEIEDV
jgi:hypothetical protein